MTALSPKLGEIGNLIFLSYRRDDAAAQTLALRFELETRLRAVQVFLDTRIQAGNKWPEEIQKALSRAKVVIAVIGQAWTGPPTEPRRIDNSDDWVHQEVALALKRKGSFILPILIDGATWETIKLPDPIKELATRESLELKLRAWETGIDKITETLKSPKYGFKLKKDPIRLPPHDKVKELCPPFPWDKLEQVMRELEQGWQIEFSDDPETPNYKQVYLARDFVFQSFEQAMKFMAEVGKFASESNHHPRWMNVWHTVRVWLSTWDAGSRITPLDTQLARFMERKYKEFQV